MHNREFDPDDHRYKMRDYLDRTAAAKAFKPRPGHIIPLSTVQRHARTLLTGPIPAWLTGPIPAWLNSTAIVSEQRSPIVSDADSL